MKIAISGSHGLVGGYVRNKLKGEGHDVVRIIRKRRGDRAPDIYMSLRDESIDVRKLEGNQAVIHLAGAPIVDKRWTKERKQLIYDSRINGTRILCESIARMKRRPKILLCASAIGYYGDRGDEILDEESGSGDGFLAEVCRDWEAAVQPAVDAGLRVVNMRFGVVLSTEGGALEKMIPVFRRGFGGKLGTGNQYMSWISLQDVYYVMSDLLHDVSLSGPVNMVSPGPVTNRAFTQALGAAVRRPTLFNTPAAILRIALGEMADEALLASHKVIPKRLINAGYEFRFMDIDKTLDHLVNYKL
jgi:uncharacterized protein (TIGR01777 family)